MADLKKLTQINRPVGLTFQASSTSSRGIRAKLLIHSGPRNLQALVGFQLLALRFTK